MIFSASRSGSETRAEKAWQGRVTASPRPGSSCGLRPSPEPRERVSSRAGDDPSRKGCTVLPRQGWPALPRCLRCRLHLVTLRVWMPDCPDGVCHAPFSLPAVLLLEDGLLAGESSCHHGLRRECAATAAHLGSPFSSRCNLNRGGRRIGPQAGLQRLISPGLRPFLARQISH